MGGKASRNRHRGGVHIAGFHQSRLPDRQGACLVEQHGVDFGQSLHRRAFLDHDAMPKEPACRHHLHHRNSKAKRTGAGDDENRNRDQHRLLPVTAQNAPTEKGHESKKMYDGRIIARGTVGNPPIARPPPFRRLHQPDHFRQKRILCRCGHPRGERTGEIEGACLEQIARLHPTRRAFAVDNGHVEIAASASDHRIHRHAVTGSNRNRHAG